MVGQNIGKYRVLDRIGRGGMGTVYRAIDETLRREVAIKVLNAELNDPAVGKRFRAEAITVARLSHPGIATIYELFQNEGEWLMVMEFVRGETLEALLSRKGPLPIDQAVDMCMQALGALAHAHSLGVVHRDLKPANVMVTDSGTVKIMDFGIARVVGTEHLTSAGFMMGTPAYMAPEQVMGQDIDARADLYAMGVVLFHLLSGKLPFKGDTPFEMAQSRIRDQPFDIRTIRAELPQWISHVLTISLAREPERRHQTSPIFREALRRGLAGLPLETPAMSSIPPELVATAAPQSLPVSRPAPTAPARDPAMTMMAGSVTPVTTKTPTPAPTIPPSVIAIPTRTETPARTPTAAQPVATSASTTNVVSPPTVLPGSVGNRRSMTAVVAAMVVLAAGIGGWLVMRRPAAPAVVEAPESPAPVAIPIDAPPNPVVTVPPANVASESPKGSDAAPAASSLSSVPVPPPTENSAAGARGAALETIPPVAAVPARGRRGSAPDPVANFSNLRMLVVSGKKADEQPVTLTIGNGQFSAVGARGAALVGIPYRDVTYAGYARSKDPKWSVVLAAPAVDVDLPGGLFRSARHWLTLQSRTTYLILRLNDGDWREVLDVVAARTGRPVERPAGGQ